MQKQMQTVVMDMAAIAAAREKVQHKDPAVKGMLEQLLSEAGKALAKRAPSVMDKKMVPPSGDRHDYMSVGPYWWPNPEKPDGLPWVRRDGDVNPATQTHDFDHGAMTEMCREVEALVLAARVTGETEYAYKAGEMLKTWFLNPDTRMNPHLNYGQAVPGVNTGRGIGIIETASLAMLVDAVELLAGQPGWSEKDMRGMREWFGDYLTWLMESPHGINERDERNNHGTWYDVQAARFALFCGRREIAVRTLKEAFKKRVVAHVRPDGSQPHELSRTRSFDYSLYNLKALLMLCLIGNAVEVPITGKEGADGASVQNALDFVAPYADASLEWPYPQIAKYGRGSLVVVLRLGHAVYGEEKYVELLTQMPAEQRERDLSWFYLPCGV